MTFVRLTRSMLVVGLFGVASTRSDEIDDFVHREMERQHIPGMSIAIVQDGKIVRAQGYGYSNLELQTPAKPDTVYKIASISKQFLAAGVMKLVEGGKLSLDDLANRFLDDPPEAWQSITIRQLLSHTSGIQREAPGFHPLQVQPDKDVIRSCYDRPLVFEPGSKWQYCNAGYFIVGEIITRASEQSWPAYLKESFFTPLHMGNTRETTATNLVPHRANGYVFDKRELKYSNAPFYLAVRPSGALLSTVEDLAKWNIALDQATILRRDTLDAMWKEISLTDGTTHPYGLGFQLNKVLGRPAVSHGGSLPGFRSHVIRLVEERGTVIVLTNSDDANASLLAFGIARRGIPGMNLKSPPRAAVD